MADEADPQEYETMARSDKRYDIEPGLLKLALLDLDTTKPWLIRAANVALRAASRLPGSTRAVRMTRHTLADGLRVDAYRPRDAGEQPLPCFIYLHGGGFYLEGLPAHRTLCQHYAQHARCLVLYPHYTLALTAPYPAAIDDCRAALMWAASEAGAGEVGADPARIAVGGDSAGGALAASLCLRARDEGGPAPLFQLLTWPAIDDTMSTPSMIAMTDTPLWDAGKTARMWRYYLGDATPTAAAAPGRAATLRSLAPAYIETAQHDPLRDEGVMYANRLRADGVPVTLNQTQRTIHAYDLLYDHPITQENLARRVTYMTEAFGRPTS
jgi:acetyl esterase